MSLLLSETGHGVEIGRDNGAYAWKDAEMTSKNNIIRKSKKRKKKNKKQQNKTADSDVYKSTCSE